MTTTKTKHGRYEHGKPERGEGGCCHRLDRYFSDDPEYSKLTDPSGRGLLDRIACSGMADDSGYYDGRYDGEHCPCCYLGHGHTTALHNRYVTPLPIPGHPAAGWRAEPRDLPGNGQDDDEIAAPTYPQE